MQQDIQKSETELNNTLELKRYHIGRQEYEKVAVYRDKEKKLIQKIDDLKDRIKKLKTCIKCNGDGWTEHSPGIIRNCSCEKDE